MVADKNTKVEELFEKKSIVFVSGEKEIKISSNMQVEFCSVSFTLLMYYSNFN